MSDFFTRASEAAQGVRRAAQPLVASRYAPGPHQPVLEMKTVVDAKSNEASDQLRGAALSDLPDVYDQTTEVQTLYEDGTTLPVTRALETVTALQVQSVPERQNEVAFTTQPDEYSSQSTAGRQEVSILTRSEDRIPANTRVSIRPAGVNVLDAEEPQNQRTTAAIAPLAVQSMSIDAAEAQTAVAAAAGELELSEAPSNSSAANADRPGRSISVADKPTLRDRSISVAAREVVDPARRPFNRFDELAIVTTKSNEVGPTEPNNHLDQSLISARDERSRPENSTLRSVATRSVPQQSAVSYPGARDAQEPPIIRVNIGRIEVRAAAPPAPPVETPAPPKPKMSLDEYLRQQNGRRP